MFKKTILTAATIAISLVAFQPAAQAGNIKIGVQIGGGHSGHGGHGHGGHGHWGSGHGNGHGYNKLSCYRGKSKLRWNGYYNVRPYDCNGTRYGYRAIRNHRIYDVKMNAFTGRYSKQFVGYVY